MMHQINRSRGIRSKALGGQWEKIIDSSCLAYARKGIAFIEKTPEPLKMIGKNPDGTIKAVFEKKGQPDYKGMIIGGRAVEFDAKYTDKEYIVPNVLKSHQLEQLLQAERFGAIAGVLVSLRFKEFFFVPISFWNRMYLEKKTMKMDSLLLAEYQVPNVGYEIKFLEREHNV